MFQRVSEAFQAVSEGKKEELIEHFSMNRVSWVSGGTIKFQRRPRGSQVRLRGNSGGLSRVLGVPGDPRGVSRSF